MAYMNQERKAKRAPLVREILKKYGIKGTLSIHNHSSLVLNIKSGKIDFVRNFNETVARRTNGRDFIAAKSNISVNTYWFQDQFSDNAKNFLSEVIKALKGDDYFNDTDIQTDYFHCSHYVDVNIGRWDRPYELTA